VYWLNVIKRIRNDVWERIDARDRTLTYSAVDRGSMTAIQLKQSTSRRGKYEIDLQDRHYDLLFKTSSPHNVSLLACDLR
jgi:hypothetical protein